MPHDARIMIYCTSDILVKHRFAKHRYDFKKRPENSELADHFHNGHLLDDLQLTILESGFASTKERERVEDKWMCCLLTMSPNGLNKDCGGYAKEL